MSLNLPITIYPIKYVKLRNVKFNRHSFLGNQHIIASIFNDFYIHMLQKTRLSDDDSLKLGKLKTIFHYHVVAAIKIVINFLEDHAAGYHFCGVNH